MGDHRIRHRTDRDNSKGTSLMCAEHDQIGAEGLRCDVNLIVETGTARDPHHMACLIGVGATAVYPYLAYQTLFDLGRRGILQLKKGGEHAQIGRSYRKGIYKGLSKIISKMGICTISSYRGAQLFEIVGLDPDVVDLCFAETPSRIGGVGFERLDLEARQPNRAERREGRGDGEDGAAMPAHEVGQGHGAQRGPAPVHRGMRDDVR